MTAMPPYLLTSIVNYTHCLNVCYGVFLAGCDGIQAMLQVRPSRLFGCVALDIAEILEVAPREMGAVQLQSADPSPP